MGNHTCIYNINATLHWQYSEDLMLRTRSRTEELEMSLRDSALLVVARRFTHCTFI